MDGESLVSVRLCILRTRCVTSLTLTTALRGVEPPDSGQILGASPNNVRRVAPWDLPCQISMMRTHRLTRRSFSSHTDTSVRTSRKYCVNRTWSIVKRTCRFPVRPIRIPAHGAVMLADVFPLHRYDAGASSQWSADDCVLSQLRLSHVSSHRRDRNRMITSSI